MQLSQYWPPKIKIHHQSIQTSQFVVHHIWADELEFERHSGVHQGYRILTQSLLFLESFWGSVAAPNTPEQGT